MRCCEAQKRLNALSFELAEANSNRSVLEHIPNCPYCTELLAVQQLIAEDLQHLFSETHTEAPDFRDLQTRVRSKLNQRKGPEMRTTLRSNIRVFIAGRPMMGLSAGLVIAMVVVMALLPFSYEETVGYEVAVAGVDESLISSGAIGDLLSAVGLPDAGIEVVSCVPKCFLIVTGLKSTKDAQVAVVAMQAIKDVHIRSVDTFTDKRTGVSVTRTRSTSQMTISDGQWTLELGRNSAIYQRVSIALDSLKRDTTVSWTHWIHSDEDSVRGVQQEYSVNPDGSYSNSILTAPSAKLGWRKSTWTFDSTGMPVSYIVTDTFGLDHEIAFRNWVVMEEQLKEVGWYHMITYDNSGTPCQTATNVDPAESALDTHNLATGMYLNQNRPNPFDTLTHITLGLPEKARARLEIYDRNSILVRTLVDSVLAAGEHTIAWDVRSDEGKRVYSRVFLCKLQVGEYYHTIAMSQVW